MKKVVQRLRLILATQYAKRVHRQTKPLLRQGLQKIKQGEEGIHTVREEQSGINRLLKPNYRPLSLAEEQRLEGKSNQKIREGNEDRKRAIQIRKKRLAYARLIRGIKKR